MLVLVLFAVSLCILSIVPNSPLFPSPNDFIIGTAEPPGDLDEILTVNANTGKNILTQRKYAGTVMIDIRAPWLQVLPTPEGSLYSPPVVGLPFSFSDFWVDDIKLETWEFTMGLHGFWTSGYWPSYHPVYGYQMLYGVGDKPRTIAFRMDNPKIPNTKSFEVLVSIENRYCCFGR